MGAASHVREACRSIVVDYTYQDIADMIDHSLLVPELTEQQLIDGCKLAVEYGMASAFMHPYALPLCAPILQAGGAKAGTTISFPQGIQATEVKLAEARKALDDGGDELDMVVNISQVLSDKWDYVADEIAAVNEAVHAGGAKFKVIFENCYLTDDQKIRLCEICGEIGVDWVKTSTGFAPGTGAVLADLILMRKHSPPSVQVKAAGGVKTLDQVLEMRAVGTTRVGVSSSVAILEECKRRLAAAE